MPMKNFTQEEMQKVTKEKPAHLAQSIRVAKR